MELPLHYDLDVFKEYYTDYLEGYEKDTLMQVVKTDRLIDYYSYFVSEKGDVITFKNEYEVYIDGKIDSIKINDIVFIITSTVSKYLKERIENYVEINDDSLKEFIINITKHYEEELQYLTAIIAKSEYSGRFYELDLRLVDFIITHLRCWHGRYFLNEFSENSKIEIVKIFRFLKNNQVENNQTAQPQPVEVPELKTEPYNEKERGSNVPYKLALLHEMKVIETLNLQFPSKSDIFRILKFLVGGNEDNIKDYYNSIYGNYSGERQINETHISTAKQIYFK